ncbi:MAG: hypothetical protein ACRD1I_05230 [Terriglobia bacterium]
MAERERVSIARLIAIPAVITLGVTILRLAGELEHWPAPWFNASAGGGGALVGISWLPIIFGPYFAWKLAGTGEGPEKMGKAAMFWGLGLIVFVAGGFIVFSTISHPSNITLIGFLLMLVAACIPRLGWRSLGGVLLAYAFAARIPVLIVMFFAMRGNGGAGWGTHYDAVTPALAHASFGARFFDAAVVPQMTLWIGWTVIVGLLLGIILVAVKHPGRQPAPAGA